LPQSSAERRDADLFDPDEEMEEFGRYIQQMREADPSGRPDGGHGLGRDGCQAQRRGRPRPLNDSWVAACCIEGGLPLLTLNRRDFMDFAERDGLVLLTA
jgi:predicted nucleic acid-binding protein